MTAPSVVRRQRRTRGRAAVTQAAFRPLGAQGLYRTTCSSPAGAARWAHHANGEIGVRRQGHPATHRADTSTRRRPGRDAGDDAAETRNDAAHADGTCAGRRRHVGTGREIQRRVGLPPPRSGPTRRRDPRCDRLDRPIARAVAKRRQRQRGHTLAVHAKLRRRTVAPVTATRARAGPHDQRRPAPGRVGIGQIGAHHLVEDLARVARPSLSRSLVLADRRVLDRRAPGRRVGDREAGCLGGERSLMDTPSSATWRRRRRPFRTTESLRRVRDQSGCLTSVPGPATDARRRPASVSKPAREKRSRRSPATALRRSGRPGASTARPSTVSAASFGSRRQLDRPDHAPPES